MKVQIVDITIDQEVQLESRPVDEAVVQSYAEAIEGGAQFPPVIVFQDNGTLWLADGLHRVEAHDALGLTEIEADVRDGTLEDAMVYAAIANVANGKAMSRAEKQEAGERLLKMTNWSDREIARQLAINNATVGIWRKNLSVENSTDSTRTVIRNGQTYEMNVENIGQHQMDMYDPTPAEKLTESVGEDAHEPVAENTATELAQIVEDAQKASAEPDTPLKDQSLENQALTLANSLERTEKKKEVLKSCQGWVVAHLTRTGLWKAHPDGYTHIRQYLKAAGVKPRDVTTLTGFSEKVVPYCDAKGIEIDHLLTNEYWDKFRAAVPPLKDAIKQDDPEKVKEILHDVRTALIVSSITDKYRKPGEILARGTTFRIKDRVGVLLVCGTDTVDADRAADRIVTRVGRQVKWCLQIVEDKDGMHSVRDIEEGTADEVNQKALKGLLND